MSTFYAEYPVFGGGVTSLDGMTGALTLVAGTGISIVDGAGTITVSSTSAGDVTFTAFGSTPNAAGASITGQAITLQPADATHPGGVSILSQSFAGIKNFQNNIFAANLSGTNSGDVTLGTANGLSLVGQALSLALSSTSTTGALSSTDWNTFNGKQGALTLTNLTDAGTDGITITNGTGAVIGASPVTISQHVADTTHNGYLSSTDWTTFNGKQGAGNYITALTGDGTASGPGSAALTLATVNSNVGSFGGATAVGTFTVNGKGLVTAAGSTSIQIAESQVTNLVSDLAGKQATGNYITALTGDVTATGPGSVASTLATVNSNVGSFTNASLTVNAKGLVTAASNGIAPTVVYAPMTIQKLTTGTAATYNKNYTFVITSGSATVGATYTNNAVTFTVYATVASATQVVMSGSGAPAASGTLTKASGTGDATLTFSQFIAPLYLRIRALGGGGGGSGSSASASGNHGAGNVTTASTASSFGSSLITASPGAGGAAGAGAGTLTSGGAGGGVTINSPAINVYSAQGSFGGPGSLSGTAGQTTGGQGGASPFGGYGVSGTGNATGVAAIGNSGSGGGGAGTTTVGLSGGGGGAGGYAEAIIPNPSATYTYTVGVSGTGGAAGTSGSVGGQGGTGLIIVEEHYQ